MKNKYKHLKSEEHSYKQNSFSRSSKRVLREIDFYQKVDGISFYIEPTNLQSELKKSDKKERNNYNTFNKFKGLIGYEEAKHIAPQIKEQVKDTIKKRITVNVKVTLPETYIHNGVTTNITYIEINQTGLVRLPVTQKVEIAPYNPNSRNTRNSDFSLLKRTKTPNLEDISD